jgi:hypothetical protein
MSEHVAQTLEDVKQAVAELERQLAEKKRMANWLSIEMAGGPPIYEITESSDAKPQVGLPTRGDEFVGMKASSAFRKVLEMQDCPLDVNEIYDALLKGGYQFDTKTATNAKNSLRVTLSKNSSIFHKLTNGKYGLVKWYGNVKTSNGKRKSDDSTEEDEDGRGVMAEEFGGIGSEEESVKK